MCGSSGNLAANGPVALDKVKQMFYTKRVKGGAAAREIAVPATSGRKGDDMANVVFNPGMVGGWDDTLPAPTNGVARTGGAVAGKPRVIGWVKMAPDVLRAMHVAAQHAGRGVGDVWAEAAREWLLRRTLDVDYDAVSNTPQRRREQGALSEQRTRLWTNIDSMMGDLREDRPTL